MDRYIEQIMEQSRHQFIYSYDGEERTKILKKMEQLYPIQKDIDRPSAIYLEDFGFPNIKSTNNNLDKDIIQIICSEYFNFNVIYHILEKSKDNINEKELDERIQEILRFLNYSVNKKYYTEMKSFDDLVKYIKIGKYFYYNYFQAYMSDKENKYAIDKIPMAFIILEYFLTEYKKALNNNSYFAVIIDKQKEIFSGSITAINNFLGSRINASLAIKVAVDPRGWNTYFDSNGNLVQAVHDYGIVEMDNSFKEYVRELKRNY